MAGVFETENDKYKEPVGETIAREDTGYPVCPDHDGMVDDDGDTVCVLCGYILRVGPYGIDGMTPWGLISFRSSLCTSSSEFGV